MSTDAAATLTLRIDTGQAKADLELLKEKYGDLLAVMRAPARPPLWRASWLHCRPHHCARCASHWPHRLARRRLE